MIEGARIYAGYHEGGMMNTMVQLKHIAALALLILLGAACNQSTEKPNQSSKTQRQTGPQNIIVAAVDEAPILARDLMAFQAAQDGGMTNEEALNILIRNQLLANEANRRGYGIFLKVSDARKTAMARALLKKRVGREVNTSSIDEQRLRKLYEVKKSLFVHGELRRVDHIVVQVMKKGLSSDEAAELARVLFSDLRQNRVESEEDFLQFAKKAVEIHGKNKVKLEELPPFEETTANFAQPFVNASFRLRREGETSPITETKFGYHIIFLAEIIPPKNQSFAEARDIIAEKWLPTEQKLQTKQLMDNLLKSGNVFIYENVLNEMEWSP